MTDKFFWADTILGCILEKHGDSISAGAHKEICESIWNKVVQLEKEKERLDEQKDYWWRKACGRFRILTQIKEHVMTPEKYYTWAKKYIDEEETALQQALRGG